MDLDDLCLLLILKNLSPLPDLFHVARTNQRLRGLASGRRLYLVVSASEDEDDAPTASSDNKHPSSLGSLESYAGAVLQSSLRFQTIADAVASSRPGNTILLKPGTHKADEPTVVSWPLHFIGDGVDAKDTAVIVGRDTDLAFDFRASGKMTNISIKARQNICVLHRSSSLQMQRCLLSCCPERGLEHLASPLVTIANGAHANRHPGESSGGQRRRRFDPAFFFEQARKSVAGPGLLLVKESRIVGSGQAVRCSGSGSLKGVRVIYQSTDPLFWFYVDSAQQEGKAAAGPVSGPGIGLFAAGKVAASSSSSSSPSSSSWDQHQHDRHHHNLCFLEDETRAIGSKAPIRPSLLELEPEKPEALQHSSKRSRLS